MSEGSDTALQGRDRILERRGARRMSSSLFMRKVARKRPAGFSPRRPPESVGGVSA
jgi:hypothetical protein